MGSGYSGGRSGATTNRSKPSDNVPIPARVASEPRGDASTGGGLGVALTLSLLTPLPLTVVFWRDLVWGDKRSDLLLALASVIVSALFIMLLS